MTKKRLQFSLIGLFGIISAWGIVVGLTFSVPSWFAEPTLLFITLAMPGLLVTGAFYGGRWVRPYCFGAFFAHIAMFLYVAESLDSIFDWAVMGIHPKGPIGEFEIRFLGAEHWRRMMGCMILVANVTGLLCVVLRHAIEGPRTGS